MASLHFRRKNISNLQFLRLYAAVFIFYSGLCQFRDRKFPTVCRNTTLPSGKHWLLHLVWMSQPDVAKISGQTYPQLVYLYHILAIIRRNFFRRNSIRCRRKRLWRRGSKSWNSKSRKTKTRDSLAAALKRTLPKAFPSSDSFIARGKLPWKNFCTFLFLKKFRVVGDLLLHDFTLILFLLNLTIFDPVFLSSNFFTSKCRPEFSCLTSSRPFCCPEAFFSPTATGFGNIW